MVQPEPEQMDVHDREEFDRLQADLDKETAKANRPAFAMTRVLEEHAPELESLWRHEQALMRSMTRALHELQRLQAARSGGQVSAPAVLDVDLNITHEKGDNSE